MLINASLHRLLDQLIFMVERVAKMSLYLIFERKNLVNTKLGM